MDHTILHRKLSTYVTEGGYLRNVNDDLLYEVLCAWEAWSGTAKEFYKSVGFSQRKMASLIGKAKKLKREGHFGSENFKEVHVEGFDEVEFKLGESDRTGMIEVDRGNGLLIRFPSVPVLIDYLKKAG